MGALSVTGNSHYQEPFKPLIGGIRFAGFNDLESGNVGGGMLPKIQNCVDAVKAGVGKVHILDGRMEHSLLLEFFTKTGIGTVITGEKEETHE